MSGRAHICLLAMFAALAVAARAGTGSVRIGYVLGFRSEHMKQEYRLAIEVLMKKVFESFGHDIRMCAYESPQAVLDAFWGGEIDVSELSSIEYAMLDKKRRDEIRALVSVDVADSNMEDYLLLAPVGQELEDLAGKDVRLAGRGDWNVGVGWLNMLLQQRVGMGPAEFFGDCKLLDFEEAGDIVLPVFFGKADACLVMRHQFDLLAELNPQVAKRLQVVAASPPILGIVFIVRNSFDKMDPAELAEIAAKLHTTPDGEQACTLLKINRLSRVVPEELASMAQFAGAMDGLEVSKPSQLDFKE